MYEIVTLGRGWLYYIASAHIVVNVVEEICQYVKFVLSTKNYDHACNTDEIELKLKKNFPVRLSLLIWSQQYFSLARKTFWDKVLLQNFTRVLLRLYM